MHKILIALFLIIFIIPAYAQDENTQKPLDPILNPPEKAEKIQHKQATTSHAMTMHGTPKYDPDFTHVDYVNPEAPKGGTLKQHRIGTFDSLNPFIVKGTPAAGLSFLGQSLLYDSLMKQTNDEPFSMYCLICETVERDPANKYITFNLRPEARWHDGAPITAHDVVWSFNNFLKHGSPFFKAYYGDVEDVIAKSDTRVTFTFKHTKNAELPLIIGQIAILPKHYWTQEGKNFNQTSLEPPLGSGPYEVKTVNAGRSISYERVKDYWAKDIPINKGRFNFDHVVYDYYRDSNVALEAFFAGEYDTREENTAKLWASSYNTAAVEDGRIIKKEIAHQRPQGMQGFIYNIRRPVFQDITVRKALSYAFDFEWSNKQFAYGAYKRSRSYFSNSELASSGLPEGLELKILEQFRGRIPEEIFTSTYTPPTTDGSGKMRKNLRTAMKLLDEAGYELGNDGIRSKDGVRLEFEIIDSNPQFERWVLPILKNLERIGVKASFRTVDSAQYQNRMNNFDYDMTIMSFGQSSSPGNEQRDFWGSDKADMQGSRNYIGVKNPVVDELIEQLIQAESREDLVAYTHALDRILLSGYYLIPQWHVDHWRLAWWNKLAHPDTLSPLTPGILDTWWVK